MTQTRRVHRQSDCPSLGISPNALAEHAKLYRVEVVRPREIIGRTTVDAIQSGLTFGYPALVERGVRERCEKTRVVATGGGLADLIAPESTTIEDVDGFLTVNSLRLIFERNRRPELPGLEGSARSIANG